MIFIFGDSHANFCMKDFKFENINLYQNSITMYRVGRDSNIPNFNNVFNNIESVFLFFYGEVDCRCHIYRQLNLERKLEDIIEELTENYLLTITKNITIFNKIIVSSITPPIRRKEFEDIHGPITHEFPMLGSDEERVYYTKLMNESLKNKCEKYDFIFYDFTDFYSNLDGTLKYELSDGICHIKENQHILDSIEKLIQ